MFEHNDFSNKKILVIVPSYPDKDNLFIGGSFVKNQLDSLKEHVKEIIVIAPTLFSFKMLPKDRVCENYSYDNVKVYFPRCYYIPIFYCSKILIDNRLKVIENLLKSENIQFDLIHAHFSWPSAYIGVKIKEKFDVPVIVTIHENAEWLNKEINMNHPLINYAWEKADVLIRVNKKDVPILKKYNKNTYSIPNGYSSQYRILDKKECRKRLNLEQDKQILFAIGNLIERKGFNFLIDAIKISVKNNHNILCVIGGSGPLKKKLQKQIDELNMNDHVILAGFIPEELLPVWMNACDVFVLPSLSESFGIVQIEALACGKPVVATYNGGSEEIITSEDYGFLVEPENSYDLAENILLALDKEWNNNKIREYAEQFNWKKIVNEIIDIYKDVL